MAEDVLITLDKIRHHINNMPELLFEKDGCVVSLATDNVFADLYGMDEEPIELGLMLAPALPEVRMPLRRRPSLAIDPDDLSPSFHVANYVQQNVWGRAALSAEYAPPGLTINMTTYQADILLVRYRRRL